MNTDRAITLENRLNQLQRGIQSTRKRRIEAYETYINSLESKFVEYKVERDKTLENIKNSVISANKELAQENKKLIQLENKINDTLEKLRTRFQIRPNLSASSSLGATKGTDFDDLEASINERFKNIREELISSERDYVSPRTKGLLNVLQKLIEIKGTVDGLAAESEASASIGDNGDAVIARMQQQLLPSIRRLSGEAEDDESSIATTIQKRMALIQDKLETEKQKRHDCEGTLMALLEKVTQATLEADIE